MSDRTSENGGFRRIVTDFGGSGTIQGTEDLSFDPQVADVRAIGLAALFGFAIMASVPQGLSVPIPFGVDSTVIGAIEAWSPFVAALIPTLSTAIGLLAAGVCPRSVGDRVSMPGRSGTAGVAPGDPSLQVSAEAPHPARRRRAQADSIARRYRADGLDPRHGAANGRDARRTR